MSDCKGQVNLKGSTTGAVRRVIAALCLFILGLGLVGCKEEDQVLSAQQIHYWTVPPAEGRFPTPRSVSIGPNDEVLALDNAGRLLLYDQNGKLLRQWKMPANDDGNAEGTCWLKDGRIAVADTHYHQVVFFSPHGELLGTLGKSSAVGAEVTGEAPGGTFVFPVSVVQDDQENIYVAEYGGNDRVQKFDKNGNFVLAFGSAGTQPGQFQRASGMVWQREPDGQARLYVADAENGRVQVFTDTGDFLYSVGRSGHPTAKPADTKAAQTDDANDAPKRVAMRFPYDVDIGPDGNLYVIEWGAGRFSKFTKRGELLGRFGRPGMGEGQFRTPWGIAVDSKGRVRVADTQNRRIVAIILD